MAGIKLKKYTEILSGGRPECTGLNGIDLDIPQGQITVILGQSGCGKTTLLRLTGGLEGG
ncbi:MAG: ATP-binding cassette domain-containing protein [Clostridium sp.]